MDEKKYYSSKGFALIYEDKLYEQKVVNRKIKNDQLVLLHDTLKRNTIIEITNPITSISIEAKVINKAKYPAIFNIVISEKIEQVEDKISDIVSEKNVKHIKEHFKSLSIGQGTFNNLKMWKLKKKIMPRSYDPPMAKRDQGGNLITTKTKLKSLYKMTYTDRLTQNEIKPQFKMLYQWKDLCAIKG